MVILISFLDIIILGSFQSKKTVLALNCLYLSVRALISTVSLSEICLRPASALFLELWKI